MKINVNDERKEIDKFLSEISDKNLWYGFAVTRKLLYKKGLARTRNIISERGEKIAEAILKKRYSRDTVVLAEKSTKDYDIIRNNKYKYSIKTITGTNSTTGTFHGIKSKKDIFRKDIPFNSLIVVQLDENLDSVNVFECGWKAAVNIMRNHKTMKAPNVTMTKHNKKSYFKKIDE